MIDHFMRMEPNVQIKAYHREPAEEEKCNQTPLSTAGVRIQLGADELLYNLSQFDQGDPKYNDRPENKLEAGWFHIAAEISSVVSERDGIEFNSGIYAVLHVVEG